MVNTSKSLGILLVIIGTILFFVVCGEFILRMILAIGALFVINKGLQLQGSAPLSMQAGMWTSRMWNTPPRDYR
jgi:multisubunit Na+/H+ antiporter MnhG subunit